MWAESRGTVNVLFILYWHIAKKKKSQILWLLTSALVDLQMSLNDKTTAYPQIPTTAPLCLREEKEKEKKKREKNAPPHSSSVSRKEKKTQN